VLASSLYWHDLDREAKLQGICTFNRLLVWH